MKYRIWESRWHDINFIDLNTKLSFFKNPSKDFYKEFYKEFFKKYKNFDDLPKNWKNEKKIVAKEICKLINPTDNVLSYGCGSGYIEEEIINEINIKSIDAYDIIFDLGRLSKNNKINFINTLSEKKDYDFIYFSQVIHALNDYEIIKLLKFIKTKLSKKGKLLTINFSTKSNENGIKIKKKIFKNFIKIKMKPLYFFLFKKKIFQFWGWQRSNDEISKLFLNCGFKKIKNFSSAKQSFLVFELNN